MSMSGRSQAGNVSRAASGLVLLLASARAGAAPPAVPSSPRAPHPIPGADRDSSPAGPVAPGAWSENKLYRFRLERVEACGVGPASLKGETSWVGAFFTVEASGSRVFVSPRDLELRRGGVVLSATFINPPSLPGCRPLLNARRLKVGETTSGFALFEVPKTFRIKTDDPIVLSYRPTRWGGARRAEVPIPECLDACARPWLSAASGDARARAAGSPRRDSRKP
jgi:hypothetical protein